MTRSPVAACSLGMVAALGLAAGLASALACPAHAQTIDPNLWVTNGPVHTVAAGGGRIYLGGNFSRVGPATGGGVPLDPSTGSPLSSFPKVTGSVFAAASDGAGGWFIGGNFTSVGGRPRNHIAHILSDMSVSDWNPGTGNLGAVYALAMSGTSVYVGGSFSSGQGSTIGGQPRNFIAALDATSGAATAWNPSADNLVTSLAVTGTTIYAGGYFTNISGQPRNFVAALDVTTGAATSWNPDANERVWALAVRDSIVYAGGYFTNIGGQPRNHVVALDATNGAATAWNPDASSHVFALAVDGSTVYAGGSFTSIGGVPRRAIAQLDAATGAATPWDPDANAVPGHGGAPEVRALAVSGSIVYAGGFFDNIGGLARRRVAAIDATTGIATTWSPDPDESVSALAVSGSAVFVGGEFRSLGGQARYGIAALDASTGAVTDWNPNSDDQTMDVHALVFSGDVVYVGGYFGNIGGQSRWRLAALDAQTGLATPWNPGTLEGKVFAIAVSGSTVYVGGGFSDVAGQHHVNLAAVDATTGALKPFTADADFAGYVRTLAVSGSTLYAGGEFTTINGVPRNHIGAMNAVTGAVTSWNPDANDFVHALAADGATVYAGGRFTSIGGQARYYGASLDATTGNATGWTPYFGGAPVEALLVSGCTVYSSGFYNDRSPVDRVAGFDVGSGARRTWSHGTMNGEPYALAVSGSKLYVGGSFTAIGGLPQSYIAAVSIAPTVVAVQPASGGNDGDVTVTISGTNLVSCTSARLTRAGQPDIPGSGITASADDQSLAATFDLRAAAPGAWDVVVENPGTGPATLPAGFTVTAVAATQLRVDVVGPDSIRAGHPTAFDLVVGNPGNIDAQAVPVWITGIPTDATITTDFPLAAPPQGAGEPDWIGVPDTLTSPGGRYLAFLLPRVPPGSVTRRVFLSVPGSIPQFRLHAAVTPPWEDGSVFRACLAGNGVTQDAACVGTQLTEIQNLLATDFQSEALNGIGVWARIGWRCEGAGTLPDAIASARRALDFLVQAVEPRGPAPASCGAVLRSLWRDSLTVHVVGSVDPNEKIGKRGAITSRQAIPYAIRFENDSAATAHAQRVSVTDVLPNEVDVNTVSLVAVTFGSTQLFPLPGLNHGTWDVDLGAARGIVVRVTAGFPGPTPLTRQLVWSFASLNRTTLQPLDPGSLDGFLPPNRSAHEGEGSVLFTVMPLAGLSTGAEIGNQGSITFDYNPTQLTEVWRNTVDNTPPASHVLPFGVGPDSAAFTVRWEALQSPPDLKDFTIYAREDAGPYHVWRLCTSATADTFSGRSGHVYSFYCQARDTLGNIEAAHATPDAQTNSTVAVGPGVHWRLALAGAQPNPAVGLIRARFTLASKEPATLEVLDVAGRRVLRRDVGASGPGEHTVVLGPPPRLPPGLYFLRLSQGGQTLRAHVVMMR